MKVTQLRVQSLWFDIMYRLVLMTPSLNDEDNEERESEHQRCEDHRRLSHATFDPQLDKFQAQGTKRRGSHVINTWYQRYEDSETSLYFIVTCSDSFLSAYQDLQSMALYASSISVKLR